MSVARRIATVVTTIVLAMGTVGIAATPAHACVGLRCAVDCLERIAAGGPGTQCPD